MEKNNENRTLYNFYGDAYETKIPSIPPIKKDVIRSRMAVYERNQERFKKIKSNNKNLFLRLKYDEKIALKRDLKSAKIEKINKIKVLKKTILDLRKITNIESAVKQELKKTRSEMIQNKKYLDSAFKWLKKTQDSPETKKTDFKMTVEKCKKNHSDFVLIQSILEIVKLNNTNSSLSSTQTKLLSNNKKLYEEILNSLIKKVSSSKVIEKKLSLGISEKITVIKKEYQDKIKEIKLYSKYKISLEEEKYTKKYAESSENNKKQTQNYINKVNSIKDESKHGIAELKSQKQDYINENKAKLNKVKKFIFRKSYIYSKHMIFLSMLKKAQLVNIDIRDYQKAELSLYNQYVNYLKASNDILKKENKASKILSNYKHNEQAFKKFIKEFIKNSDNKIKIKTIFSFHFNFLGKLEYKILFFKQMMSRINLKKGNLQKEISYNGDYLIGKSSAYIEFSENWINELDKINAERITSKLNLNRSNSSGEENPHLEKANLKKITKDIIKKWHDKKIDLHKRLKAKTLTKKAYKHTLSEYKIYKIEEIKEAKLKIGINKAKEIYKAFKWRYFGLRKIWKKVYGSKVVENRKITPIDIFKGLRWVAAIMNLILPGSSELIFFKQYKKGSILCVVSIAMYIIFIPFIFGINSEKFGGVFGLIDMGASKHDWFKGITPDARYYLLGGIIALFLLVALVIYSISSSITAYKTGKVMEQGVRPMGWIHTRRWLSSQGFPWMISLPGWLIILFIVVTPVMTSMLISFTNMGFNHEPPGRTVDWVGLEQYGKWWIFKDAGMAKSLGRVLSWTAIWTLLSSSLVILLGTVVAVIVNQNRVKYKKIWRLIYIIPWAIPAFVTIMFLKSAFQSGEDALMNNVLMKLHIINSPVEWLGKIWTVRIILVLIQGWLGHSYIFLLVTGNMQSIPKDVYEASSIDGAKNNQMFRYITLPILLSSIAPLLISQFAFNFNNFTIISLFSGGGPAYKDPTPFLEGGTDILISWIYKLTTGVAQIDGNMAFSSAMTMLAAVFSVGVASYGFAKSAAFRRF